MMRFSRKKLSRVQRFLPKWGANVRQSNQSIDKSVGLHKPTKEVSVMAWLETEEGEVLMVKQMKNHQSWALPGGKVKARESLTAALKREVREETGLQVAEAKLLDVFDRSAKTNISFLFRIRVQVIGTFTPEDPTEISEVAFKSAVPDNATPTLKYFFKRAKAGESCC